jgi:hypothetical protein
MSILYYRVKELAQLPATSANDGDLYFVRENGHLYVWDAEAQSMVGIGGGGAVASVFGRTGTVLAQDSDYSSFYDAAGSATSAAAVALASAEAYTNVETARAEAAESTLSSAITTETTRAEAAEALLAPLASPALTGSPTAPTKSALTSNTDLATTAYADSAVAVETSRAETAEATKQAALTGTGIARNGGACTELSGDVTTSGSNAASVVKVNGASVPVSKTIVGTDSSGHIVDASSAALSNNTSGTAANLSGTPALPNGTTATEQNAGSADGKVATNSYVDRAVATETTRAEAAEALLAPLASPALTGSPTAPTKSALTSNTDLATTAYADSAVAVETSRAETAEATKQAALTGTGIARNGGACTELSGDVTTSGSNAATVVKVNGAAVPTSKTIVGTNSSNQLVDASAAALSNNTSGSAASLSVSGQTGLLTFTGITSTSRAKTVRNAADTILELGGSYTPTGSWTSMTLVTPALGTPASGNLANCTALPAASVSSGALANGMTATTQTGFAGDAKLATDAYVDNQTCNSSVASQDFYTLPFGDVAYANATTTQAFFNTNESVRLTMFTIERTITFTRMTINVGTLFSGGHCYIGIYKAAAGTGSGAKLVQATFSTTSTGIVTATVAATTLTPGTYWLAFTMDNTTAQISAFAWASIPSNIYNGGSILRTVFTASAASSGVLPSSTGNTQTNGLNTANNTPLVLLEP